MDILLRDPNIEPSDEVIAQALGKSYTAYEAMRENVTDPAVGLEFSWRFYNDGKAWLCKAVGKKKTVFWLSIWPGFFKISFYFTEKNVRGVMDLDISKGLKDEFDRNRKAGKFIALVFEMKTKSQIKDLLKVIEYKKSLK